MSSSISVTSGSLFSSQKLISMYNFCREIREYDEPDLSETELAVFKAHRLLYRSTLGLRVIKKKKKKRQS